MKENKQWGLQDVRTALERLGYQRTPAAGDDRRLWYIAPSSVVAARQYVVLKPKPASRSYGIGVCFSNDRIRSVRDAAIPYSKTLPRIFGCSPLLRSEAPAWTLFDAGRALAAAGFPGWQSLKIPDPANQGSGDRQFTDLYQNFLAPLCETVTTEPLMLDGLLRKNTPFDWMGSNPPLRAAEALSVAAVTEGMTAVRALLPERQPLLPIDLRHGDAWKAILGRLFELFSR
jgi:hypothetical protein